LRLKQMCEILSNKVNIRSIVVGKSCFDGVLCSSEMFGAVTDTMR
jgi:hypothetical protein